MNNTVFCAECRNDVHFIMKKVEFMRTLKDKEYSFTGLELIVTNADVLFMFLK